MFYAAILYIFFAFTSNHELGNIQTLTSSCP